MLIGYAILQDDDLSDKLLNTGRSIDWDKAYTMVDQLNVNFSFIKTRDWYDRYISFSVIVNVLPTPHCLLFMKYPIKLVRDTVPRPLCVMCGVGVAEATHILQDCDINKGANRAFVEDLL